MRRRSRVPPRNSLAPVLLFLLFGCGDPTANQGETSHAAAVAEVEVAGRVASPGTRSSLLVFAFADLPPQAEVADREPTSVGSVAPGSDFALSIPPSQTLTLVFLADGPSDGVIDPGDPTAVLADPQRQLSTLQAGDHVQIADVALDFAAHLATGAIEVTHAGAPPAMTPTAVPAGESP